MRSLGEGGGLIPRPVTRYEDVRHGDGRAPAECLRTAEPREARMDDELPSPDAASRTSATTREHASIEDLDHPEGRSATPLRGALEQESIVASRRAPRGIAGEEIGVAERERAVVAPRSADRHQTVSRSVAIPHPAREVSPEEARTASDERHATIASFEGPTRRAGLEPEAPNPSFGMGDGDDRPVEKDRPRSRVRTQGMPLDPMEPILGEASFRHPSREATEPSVVERPPVVRIRIGRIEVRAVEQPALVPGKKISEPPRSSVPLDQYLRRRSREP